MNSNGRNRFTTTMHARRTRSLVTTLIGLISLTATSAIAEEAKPQAGGESGQASAAEVGKKLSDPLSDVWALFTEFNHTWSDGDITNGHEEATHIIFQPIMPFKLTANYKLITRPTLPIIYNADLPDGLRLNTNGAPDHTTDIISIGGVNFSSESGLGDMSLPMLISPVPEPGQKWSLGLGPTFVFPTATDDQLGTDTWEIGPAAVVVYKTKKFTGAVLGQYWWNYAESSNDADDTSHGSILYSAWWNLPKAWQVGFNPTITYNDKADDDDNKWNVPVGLGVAKTIKLGKLPVKFQFSVEKSVVRQDTFGKDWNVRLNVIPVIPALVKNPLFGG